MTQKADLKIEMATEADMADILSLINTVQPHVPWTEDYYRWQYLSAPARTARIQVVRDEGKIVSLLTSLQQQVMRNGVLAPAWFFQDGMTLPNYRGLGLFHRLGKAETERIKAAGDVGYMFPNKLSEKSFRRNGWTGIGLVPERKLDLATQTSTKPPVYSPNITEIQDRFDSRATRIWTGAGLIEGVWRDADFLNWRYSKPGQKYQSYWLDEDQGFMVLKLYEDGANRTLHICDLVVKEDAKELVPHALNFAIQRARDLDAQVLTAWLFETHAYSAAFNSAGLMLREGRDRYFFTLGTNESTHWHLTQGDSDVY